MVFNPTTGEVENESEPERKPVESVLLMDVFKVTTVFITGVPDPATPGSKLLSDVTSHREVPHHMGPSTLRLE